jgi:hypothetical protein
MEFLPPHIVEWFVVPLADLVALFAIADVAIVLNFFELPDVLRFLHADAIGGPHSSLARDNGHWFIEVVLSGAGPFLLFFCAGHIVCPGSHRNAASCQKNPQIL